MDLYSVFVLLSGTDDLNFVFAGITLVLIGASVSLAKKVITGINRDDNGTPNRISWKVLFFENTLRWLTGIVLSCIFLRISNEWVPTKYNWIAGIMLGYINYDLVYVLDKAKDAFLKYINRKISSLIKMFK